MPTIIHFSSPLIPDAKDQKSFACYLITRLIVVFAVTHVDNHGVWNPCNDEIIAYVQCGNLCGSVIRSKFETTGSRITSLLEI